MKKILKIVLIFILATFITIQFFQPEKNSGEISENHILKKEQIPENIRSVLENSCLDCHSNQTKYLWYHNIAPVSWMVNKHVVAGKSELNFSDWGELDIFGKIATLEDICKEVERNEMPLKEYVLLHKKAKLTDDKIAELCEWTEKLGLEILVSIEK
ncbi:MAG: heme-binding domain-containing protein [Draconibacterium sp.]|nr:heme-binding domain-containing protein [Draconibacterium sp.]